MIRTLLDLRGNPRACVYTEPLWGIPASLYLPFASLFMIALGCGDAQIGLIATLGMVSQIFFALLSGAVTDKLGRRLTTLIFDVIAWSVPTLLWAFAQNAYFFAAAAVVNGVMKITQNSWTLLLVEDAEKDKLVSIWSWITIAVIVSGLAAPLSGLLVDGIGLVPAVRIIYLFAFVSMTLKFFILYRYSTETAVGEVRLRETKGVPLLRLMRGYMGSFRAIRDNPYTLNAFFISFVLVVYETIRNVFWSIAVVKEIGLPEAAIGIFPFIKSGIMLAFYFLVVPRLNHLKFKRPFIAGFAMLIASNALLALSPAGSYAMVALSTFFEACAFALIGPFKETLLVDAIEPQDRAGIVGLFNLTTIILASPFGWIAGLLSERGRMLPFYLLTVFSIAGLALVFTTARHKKSFG